MASVPSNLYADSSIPIVKTEIIAAEANTRRILRRATFTNISGSQRIIDLYIEPDGATEVQIVASKTLVDQETWSCPDCESQVLEFTGNLSVNADGTGVTLIISGSKVTS